MKVQHSNGHPEDGDLSPPGPTGCLPVLLRTAWMAWGNVALVFSAVKMAETDATLLDTIVFLLVSGALVAVRYLYIVSFHGETAEGEPADLSHWRRYAAGVVAASALLWGLAGFVSARGGI